MIPPDYYLKPVDGTDFIFGLRGGFAFQGSFPSFLATLKDLFGVPVTKEMEDLGEKVSRTLNGPEIWAFLTRETYGKPAGVWTVPPSRPDIPAPGDPDFFPMPSPDSPEWKDPEDERKESKERDFERNQAAQAGRAGQFPGGEKLEGCQCPKKEPAPRFLPVVGLLILAALFALGMK